MLFKRNQARNNVKIFIDLILSVW